MKEGLTRGQPVDLLKLVKLVFLAHGWRLGCKGDPLIREQVEAWKYGPIVRSVYDAFKEYGKRRITKTANTGKLLKNSGEDGVEESQRSMHAFQRRQAG